MSDRAWRPELESRRFSYLLLGLSLVGGTIELATTAFVPRLVLYALVLAMGAIALSRTASPPHVRDRAGVRTVAR